VIERSQDRLQVRPLPGNNHGQVVHTRFCSPSSIIWNRSKGGDGEVTVGLASHWPCVTDSSGLSTYGLNGQHMGDEHPAYSPDGARPGLLLSVSSKSQTSKLAVTSPACYCYTTKPHYGGSSNSST